MLESMQNRLAPIQNKVAIFNGLELLGLVLTVVVLILPG